MGLRPISDQMDWAAVALLGAMNSAQVVLFALVEGHGGQSAPGGRALAKQAIGLESQVPVVGLTITLNPDGAQLGGTIPGDADLALWRQDRLHLPPAG